MPTVATIKQSTRNAIGNPNLRSVRAWLYLGPGLFNNHRPGDPFPIEDATISTATTAWFEDYNVSPAPALPDVTLPVGGASSLGVGYVGYSEPLVNATRTDLEAVLLEAFGT
jgi:hypothetical protein